MPSLRRFGGRGQPAPVAIEAPSRLLDVLRDGPAPLTGDGPQRAQADRLRVAVVVPSFRRGSGGHATIADLVRGLEARGHQLALFVVDQEGRHADDDVAALFGDFFGPVAAPVLPGLEQWRGADVALATGWQTVPDVLALPDVGARAYLVQDHEPEFYGTSAERLWAQWTYRQGLHCVCASPWLAEVVTDHYGASATAFDLGVDHAHYHALPTHRRDDLVLFYARSVTPRRAVGLGVLALAELHRRRPALALATFGESGELALPFPARQLGVLEPDALAHAYASATVGLCLSLTNPSLIPTEMLACGLPVVDVASDAMVATFGAGGPITLADPDPLALADALEGLLDDLAARALRSRDGTALVAGRTWAAAAEQVEAGLRAALAAGGLCVKVRRRRFPHEPRHGLDLRRRLPADAGWGDRLRLEERSRLAVPASAAIAWVRWRAGRRWAADETLRAAARHRMEVVLAGTPRHAEAAALARAAVLEDAAASELLRRTGRITDGRRVTGAENLRAAVASGRGVVVSYCHLGPFQGATAGVGAALGRRPWVFVGTWLDVPPGTGLSGRHVERWRRLADRAGPHTLTTTPGALRKCVELLTRGEVVCFLFDVRGGTPTPWLGKPVALATGTARMAHEADALVVPMICHRRRATPISHFAPAVDPRDHATAEDLHRALAAVHERAILERPEAFEDPTRVGAWETGASAAAWRLPRRADE